MPTSNTENRPNMPVQGSRTIGAAEGELTEISNLIRNTIRQLLSAIAIRAGSEEMRNQVFMVFEHFARSGVGTASIFVAELDREELDTDLPEVERLAHVAAKSSLRALAYAGDAMGALDAGDVLYATASLTIASQFTGHTGGLLHGGRTLASELSFAFSEAVETHGLLVSAGRKIGRDRQTANKAMVEAFARKTAGLRAGDFANKATAARAIQSKVKDFADSIGHPLSARIRSIEDMLTGMAFGAKYVNLSKG